jgi:predicted ABC-type ATPase
MSVKVFVLGRSGSGKSTVTNRIAELANNRNYLAWQMNDYHLLYKMFQEDKKGENFQPAAYGGFNVTNFGVFDKALEELERDVSRETSKGVKEIVTIEFARDSYHEAFSKFSTDFVRDAYFFFIETGVETCIERIRKRVIHPLTSDHHYVPDEIMRNYFNKDNWSYMAHEFKKQYKINKEIALYHNVGSIEKLYAQVDRFTETIFANEFSDTRPESESILAEQLIERVQVMPTVGADASLTTERIVVTL